MKRTGTLVLTLSLIAPSAFAVKANRGDVAEARTDGQQLSAGERLSLKGRVILAQIIRADIRTHQRLMDRFGLEHRATPATVTFGLGTAAGEAMLAVGATAALNKGHFGKLDKSIDYQYNAQNVQADKVKALRAEANTLRAEGVEPAATAGYEIKAGEPVPMSPTDAPIAVSREQRLANLDSEIAMREGMITEYGRMASVFTKESGVIGRVGRGARLVLGRVVLPLALLDAGLTAYQFAYDPQGADDLERRLSDFIDDARLTLDSE